MRKIYFLFLFALIASMSGLQAETVTWNITGRTSGSGPATEIVVRTDNSSSGVWTATADTEFSSGTGSGSKYIQLGSKNDPCVDVNIALSESVIPSNANITKIEVEGSATADASATVDAKVGGQVFGSQLIFGTTKEKLSFDGSASGDISLIVNTLNKKQLYLYSISVTYEISPATELTAPVITGVVNDGTYYGSATVSISYPELATSMTYTITKDGAQYKQETVIVAVEGLELNEVGSYKVEASATDGSQTLSAEAVEFKIVERPADLGTFAKVTDVATLADGDRIIIVCEEKNVAMAGDQGKYRYPADVTISDNTVVLPFDTEVAVFALGVTTDGYTFYDGTGYLNSAAEDSSDLPTGEEPFDFTVTISDGNADIVGNTRYIKVNTSAQNRFARYAANFNGADVQIYKEVNTEELVAPTIDGVTDGETYYEEKTITITCPTEGAEILYTVTKDNSEIASEIATSPIELKYSESGVYEIEAMSSKGEEKSEAVTVTFTIKSLSSITSVADFIEIGKSVGDKVVLQLNCPLTVTYKNERSIYAIDAEGSAIQIFNYNNIDEAIGQTYKAGDVIPAGIQGNLELYNDDTPEITNPVAASFQPATETAEVSPIEKTEVTIADVNQYVVVRKVTIAEAASANNYTLTNGAGTEFNAYQNSNLFFAGEVPVGNGKEYDVTGIVSTFYGNVQITITGIELSVEAGVEGVETADAAIRANADGVVVVAADAVAEVYNAAGQLVAAEAVDGESVIAVPAGFYVVRVGNTIAKVVVR